MSSSHDLTLGSVILGGILGASSALAATNGPSIPTLDEKFKDMDERQVTIVFDQLGRLIIEDESMGQLINSLTPEGNYYDPTQLAGNNGCHNKLCLGGDNSSCTNETCVV